jgi:hypothetical protein
MVPCREKGERLTMETTDAPSVFDNISQRVAYSYLRQLPHFTPANSYSDDNHNMQISQKELHDFFREFYQQVFDYQDLFGLPVKPDAYMIPGYSKEEKQAVAKQYKKPRVTIQYGIDFLYLAGKQGELINGDIHLDRHNYEIFFVKSPRVKRKFLKGMESAGLTLSEQDDLVVIRNPQYPDMMPALKTLTDACSKYDDTKMRMLLFSRCDFRVLEEGFQPGVMETIQTVIPSHDYEHASEINNTLGEMSYVPTINIGSVHEWKIQYQGNRKIKSTPFFEFEYDERQQEQFSMRVKCASTNRLVPLLTDQPDSLQEDFFHHAHSCAGDSCGWCYTRKSLEPSFIEFNGEERTICWWMQRHFTEINSEMIYLIKQYGMLHDELRTV